MMKNDLSVMTWQQHSLMHFWCGLLVMSTCGSISQRSSCAGLSWSKACPNLAHSAFSFDSQAQIQPTGQVEPICKYVPPFLTNMMGRVGPLST